MMRSAIAAATLALAVVPAATALAKSSSHAVRHTRTTRPAGESGRPVIDWNQTLVSLVSTPGVQPANVQPTWDFAVMHAAIYDAVDSIDRSHGPYALSVRAPRGASETAAADAAAHTALTALYPAQATALEGDYAAQLAKVPDGPAKAAGMRVGEQVARGLLAIRVGDGSDVASPPFVP